VIGWLREQRDRRVLPTDVAAIFDTIDNFGFAPTYDDADRVVAYYKRTRLFSMSVLLHDLPAVWSRRRCMPLITIDKAEQIRAAYLAGEAKRVARRELHGEVASVARREQIRHRQWKAKVEDTQKRKREVKWVRENWHQYRETVLSAIANCHTQMQERLTDHASLPGVLANLQTLAGEIMASFPAEPNVETESELRQRVVEAQRKLQSWYMDALWHLASTVEAFVIYGSIQSYLILRDERGWYKSPLRWNWTHVDRPSGRCLLQRYPDDNRL